MNGVKIVTGDYIWRLLRLKKDFFTDDRHARDESIQGCLFL